jgi:hypothetical protein
MASLAGIERCAGVHVVGAGILSACCGVEGREPQYSWPGARHAVNKADMGKYAAAIDLP